MVCTICGEDYIGQTKDFRKRMNNHKSDISGTPTADTLGVDKHIHYCQLQKYNTCTFSDPLFRVIPFLTVKHQKHRECLEKYYIRKFDTALKENTFYSKTIKWDKKYHCKKRPFIWKKNSHNHCMSY